MLIVLLKTFFYKLQRKYGFPKLLPINYTISLSYKCNSRCKTCGIYYKKSNELSLDEYKSFFKQVGKAPYWVTLSGGEPFLRKELFEIVKVIYDTSKPAIINIPTNGLLHERIVKLTEQICQYCKKSQININLSIDDIGKHDDFIRGVDGAYEKALLTFQGLKKIKSNCKNLNVGIHTVISVFNSQDFAYISQTLMDMKPDAYLTEIAENRVELDTLTSQISPAPWNYASAVDLLIHKIKTDTYHGFNKITQSFRLLYYEMVKKILSDEKKVYDCYAGVASMQLAPNGDVWFCCMKAQNIGNVTKEKFSDIWFSKEAAKVRKEIKDSECFCPLANVAYTNMLMNHKLLIRIFLNLLKSKIN